MKRLATVAAALVLFFACGDPTAPPHAASYAFDFGGDIFRWPADRLPVRFFADTRGHMRALVERALGIWQGKFLYGEFRAVLVDDSTAADVIVLWADSVPPDVPPDAGTPVFACDGLTNFVFDSTGVALAGPVHAEVGINLGQTFTAGQVAACVRRISIHEIGHAIGLLGHSPSPADIMWANDTTALPSEGDRRTIEVLYHTAPNITPPPR